MFVLMVGQARQEVLVQLVQFYALVGMVVMVVLIMDRLAVVEDRHQVLMQLVLLVVMVKTLQRFKAVMPQVGRVE
jgi:hypothetical protein